MLAADHVFRPGLAAFDKFSSFATSTRIPPGADCRAFARSRYSLPEMRLPNASAGPARYLRMPAALQSLMLATPRVDGIGP